MTYFEDRTSKAFDCALEMMFSASDPMAVYIPEERIADRQRRDYTDEEDD